MDACSDGWTAQNSSTERNLEAVLRTGITFSSARHAKVDANLRILPSMGQSDRSMNTGPERFVDDFIPGFETCRPGAAQATVVLEISYPSPPLAPDNSVSALYR